MAEAIIDSSNHLTLPDIKKTQYFVRGVMTERVRRNEIKINASQETIN